MSPPRPKPVRPAPPTALDLTAPLAIPTFPGPPAAPTAAPGTSSAQVATTAFVAAANAEILSSFMLMGA